MARGPGPPGRALSPGTTSCSPCSPPNKIPHGCVGTGREVAFKLPLPPAACLAPRSRHGGEHLPSHQGFAGLKPSGFSCSYQEAVGDQGFIFFFFLFSFKIILYLLV